MCLAGGFVRRLLYLSEEIASWTQPHLPYSIDTVVDALHFSCYFKIALVKLAYKPCYDFCQFFWGHKTKVQSISTRWKVRRSPKLIRLNSCQDISL